MSKDGEKEGGRDRKEREGGEREEEEKSRVRRERGRREKEEGERSTVRRERQDAGEIEIENPSSQRRLRCCRQSVCKVFVISYHGREAERRNEDERDGKEGRAKT